MYYNAIVLFLQSTFLQVIDNCFKDASCDFEKDGFGVLLMPLQWNLGELTPVAIWGFFVGIIWLRTHSVQLVGIVGLVVNSMMISFYEPARTVGYVLLALSIGIVIYQLVTNRLHHGSST